MGRPGFRLRCNSYNYTLPFPLLWPQSIRKTRTGKPPGRLEICVLSPPPFCSAHPPVGSWTRSRLHNLLSRITDINKNKQPKNISSIARLSHQWKVRTFPLNIGISLRWKRLLGNFLGGGGDGGEALKPKSVTFAQWNTIYTILGWSVEGVRRGSPWTGP